jgi:hypothetical protein
MSEQQNRHPERSASQIYLVTQRLMARSLSRAESKDHEDACLTHAVEPFQPLKPALGGSPQSFPGPTATTASILLMSGGYIYILVSHTGTLYIGVTSNLYQRVMNIRRAHWKVSLRTMAAGACSTLNVTKTFARPSLGKNN